MGCYEADPYEQITPFVSEFGAGVLPVSYVLPRLRVPMRDVGMVARLSTRRFGIAAAMASSVTMIS